MPAPTVRVWSDYICPFCYVGLARARWLQERYGASIEWLPFDLHPEYPVEGISREADDAGHGGASWRDVLVFMFEDAGLPASRDIEIVPNSLKALRLAELARACGVHDALHSRVFDAYWGRALDVGDDGVLTAEAHAAGLDADDVADVLATDRYADVVRRRTLEALDRGAGVPAFMLDRRALLPGTVSPQVFEQVLARLGHEPVPASRVA
jgi:predicted DsbA family dithiol-disulfide isomerase